MATNILKENNTTCSSNDTHITNKISSFDPTTIKTVQMVVCILTTMFGSYGLFLLITVKRRRDSTNSIVTYTNLTLLIMLSSCGLLETCVYIVAQIGWFLKHRIVSLIGQLVSRLVGAVTLSTVYMITGNRLLSAIYPIWYRTTMTKTIFYISTMVVSTVIVGVWCAPVVMYMNSRSSAMKVGAIIESVLYGGLSIFSILTYVLIFRALLESRKNSQTNSKEERNRSLFRFILKRIKEEGYVIPFAITLTYILFVNVPWIIFLYCVLRDNKACTTITIYK